MSKSKTTEHKISSGIFSLLLKQTISGVICFVIVFAMNTSGNPQLKNYAASLGYALRTEINLDPAISLLRKYIPFFDNANPPQRDEIFQ